MNAKQELMRLKNIGKIVCAYIYNEAYFGENKKEVFLKVGFSADDFEEFLQNLNFEYDSGYGGQELFGTIWLENNEWYERGEYDGSEWWEHHAYPKIPESLLS